ncbi:claudin-19 isoform X1 [Astyanax mexicanus]|uniref:Claudin n=3 Tax=Astyanax mexicanus TaxID=7994 RepID=A0A8T2LD03_ASTMX|nr:claudin-19 isoform X1 [Astyanax mexicanus]KAG9266821.1 claudin-19-like isoform X1 [Astyanax mexicanus]
MANSAVQILAYVLCFGGLCGLLVSTCMTDWKSSEHGNGETTTSVDSEGLWMRCSSGSGTQITCTPFPSILNLPTKIKVCRGLMITSIILCCLAALLTIPGLKCTKCLDESEQLKSKTAITGGVLFILGGLCALGLISWFAYNVAAEFKSTTTGLIRYTFGDALYVGGAAALVSIIGGALMCISSKPGKHFRSHVEKPSQKSQNQATAYV